MKVQSALTQSPRLAVAPLSRVSRLFAYFFSEEGAAADPRVIVLQRRAIWVGGGLILQTINFIDLSFVGADPDWSRPTTILFDALLPLLLTLASFLALGIALQPLKLFYRGGRRRTHWQRAILLLLVPVALAGCVICWDTLAESFSAPQYNNDGTSLSVNAAMLLQQGRNPYTDSSILTVARRFNIEPGWTTPLRNGQFASRLDYPSTSDLQDAFQRALKSGDAREFESKVSYPAFSFLVLVPFILLPYHNVYLFYLLSYLALIIVAWKMARPEMRPWVLLLGVANVPMWTSVLGGNLDVFYSLLLVLAWLRREQRWSSALLLGLALASKQIAWFFIPFYIILIWRTQGGREACWRICIAGSLMLAINLPFMLWNPQAWLAGILAPVVDPMFPLGVGVINLSIAHLIPFLPFVLYPLLEYGLLCCFSAWYWRLCRVHPEAAMLLAVVPLFFAWRSLPSYFCCIAYPLFVVLVARPAALKRTLRLLPRREEPLQEEMLREETYISVAEELV
ncbi:MAG: hypothetical protein NVSMB44_12530 [Ktedonobacteraceae bacterium]